ncbi:MFS transporter [Streptomyces laculatispora]|nr:MFS transporter [Streptomyces laculatispora]
MPTTTIRRDPGAITAVIALSGIVVSLMQTLVVPIIPRLPDLLHTTASNASWVITATLLAAAVVTPIAGRLGDMYGKRRVLILSLLVLVAGSLVCAVSDSLVPVIVGRALQGLATGVIPVGISVLRDELPPARVGGAVSLVSATLGVGGAIGLPVSAAIVQYANWHVLFWLAAGLGTVCLLLVTLLLSESPNLSPGRFDAPGAVMTPALENSLPQEVVDSLKRGNALPYLGSPEDIGHTMVFLASDESRYLTGQLLVVDGGMTAQSSAAPGRRAMLPA